MFFKFFKNSIFLLITLLVCCACKNDHDLEAEIAKINTDIDIERFDLLYSKANSDNFTNLKTTYPFLFSNKFSDSLWLAKKEDTLQIELFQAVHQEYPDTNTLELEIEHLFNHLDFYFGSSFRTPRVITVTSDVDYRNSVIVTDTITLIALDTYLGANHRLYEGIPRFISANMTSDQIVVDIANEYAKKFAFQSQRKTFLDEMIYFGKLLYFKDVMLPLKSEANRIGYSQNQLEWAISNESYIWRYFVERELLYSTDTKLLNRFINDAPFSKFNLEGIDNASPGRLGQYMGWQIIRAYMKNNPETSLKDMLIKEGQDLFTESKFKPRK